MDALTIFLTVPLLFFGFFALIGLFMMFYTVDQQSVAIIERFGKYVRVARAGLHFKLPFIEKIPGRVSLRVQQLDVKAETKTKDNVFVNVIISIQYRVGPERVYDAFYKLEDPHMQINSYVFDVVRAKVPAITIDELFEKKDDIAIAIKTELNDIMSDFGFDIVNSLVTDLEPVAKVKDAMNEIIAAQRLKIAAREKAEADKIMKVKAAEADAESKALQGKGIADQRIAIVNGLQASVEDFQEAIEGTSPQDVMNLILLTQYFDTLKDIGETSNTNTILIPHGPGALGDLSQQIRDAMIVAGQVQTNPKQ